MGELVTLFVSSSAQSGHVSHGLCDCLKAFVFMACRANTTSLKQSSMKRELHLKPSIRSCMNRFTLR
jgi:hypothetical protein